MSLTATPVTRTRKRLLTIVVIAMLGCAGAPTAARAFEPFFPTEPAEEPTISLWKRAIYKTITNETMANIADVALFAVFFGATASTAAGFLAVNLATHTTVYYGHEVAWNYLGPEVTDENQLSIATQKTVTYRIASAARHFALGSALGTGEAAASLAYTVAAELVDATVYFTNETLWWMFGPPAVR